MQYRTNRQVIQSIKTLIGDRTGKISDGNQWSARLILFYLMIYRSRIIYEKRKQRWEQDHRFNRQTLSCVSLQKIDKAESLFSPNSGILALKSRHFLPRPIMGKFDSVTSSLGNIIYEYVEWEHFEFRINSRIEAQKNLTYYSLKDVGEGVDIYLYNDTDKVDLVVTAIFENPLEVKYYPGCGESKPYCNPLDDPFVLDQELLTIVMELVVERLVNYRNVGIPDITPNNMDDTALGGMGTNQEK